MRSIIHSFSLPMILIISFLVYCLMQYASGTDSLSKANSVCKMFYSAGNWMDKDLLGKFDPIIGDYSNQIWHYLGQGCFYTVSHVNGRFDSKTRWNDTQLYNTSEKTYKKPTATQDSQNTPQNKKDNTVVTVYDENNSNNQSRMINEDE